MKVAQPRNLSLFNSNRLSLIGLLFSTISAVFERVGVGLLELLMFTYI